jgi:uncharacterized protein involved in exopolysaccharide biosynthesis
LAQAQTRSLEYPPSRELEGIGKPEFDATVARPGPIARMRVLWDGRRFIAKMALFGLVTGALVAFLLPKQYTSTVKLMPPDGQSSSGMAMLDALSGKVGGLAGVAGDMLGVNGSGALFVGILQSQTVQDRLVQRFDLMKVYSATFQEDARRNLAERTVIYDDRKSGIIMISVTDGSAKRASGIAQAYVEELNRLSTELSTSSAHRERVFLEERLQAVKVDLDQAAADFSQFSSKNTAIDIKDQGRAMMEAAAQLQGELIAAESEQKGLEAIYASTNPRVRAFEARSTELRKQLEKLGGVGMNESPEPASTLYPSIRQLPILAVKYADLYRRTKIQEAVYEALTRQYELAKVQEAKETPSVRILDPASVPERKSFPPRLLIVFLSGSFMLAMGAVWLVAWDQWNNAEPTAPGKIFALEVFHTINRQMPWSPPNGSRFQATTRRAWMTFVRRPEQ